MLFYFIFFCAGSLLPGDMIVEIDGADVRHLGVQEVTEKLRGAPSTDVRLVNEN
jgi:C-terminal processing protease CtpA/Prc